VRDAGWYACQNDAGWAPIGTGASGGGGSGVSSVGATQPIVSSGGTTPTLSCTPASDTVGGCLTDGGQAIGGQKYFTGGVYSTFVDAGSVAAGIYESAVSSSLLWRSHAPVNTAAMDVFTDQTWTGGDLFQINNLYQPAFSLDYTGKGTFSGGLSMYGVLKQTRGGTAMLEAADGDFVASVGELPSGYDGRHGVFTVISSNETKGGWLLELSRGVDGNPLTSNMLIVDMIGGITGSYSGTTCAKLTQCGGGEQINPDGGHQGILDGGWGYSADSAMVWLTDKNRWVYCLSSENRDAGQFGTGAGWLKMKDDTAACP
jgi:hypothetical protein